jgi:hypothetical protein
MHRQPEHAMSFFLAEMGTEGSIDGNMRLVIKGRYQPKQVESLLKKYIGQKRQRDNAVVGGWCGAGEGVRVCGRTIWLRTSFVVLLLAVLLTHSFAFFFVLLPSSFSRVRVLQHVPQPRDFFDARLGDASLFHPVRVVRFAPIRRAHQDRFPRDHAHGPTKGQGSRLSTRKRTTTVTQPIKQRLQAHNTLSTTRSSKSFCIFPPFYLSLAMPPQPREGHAAG